MTNLMQILSIFLKLAVKQSGLVFWPTLYTAVTSMAAWRCPGRLRSEIDESFSQFGVVTNFGKYCKGAFAAPPVVINFHPLPRGNVSITRQPQPGCLLFHQIMSRDHVIVIDLRKQTKPSFLPFKKNKIFTHKRHN